ncbi:MAG: hypothetical protein Q9227_002713 [Pyrenula ochraceoflavens]
MESTTSSPNQQDTANRRKSGRTTRQPALFSQEEHLGSIINGSAKRKRTPNGINGNAPEDVSDGERSSGSEEDHDEESPDEEELREQRRAVRNKRSASKPVAKKARMTNGVETPLAIRTAPSAKSRPTKAAKVQQARARKSQVNQEGLYAEVFGRGQTGEAAAAEWLSDYEKNNVQAMRDMVNFIIKCTGCDLQVESHDIEDVDNVSGKLGDLQEEYQQGNTADYPLTSRLKQYSAFRSVLVEFFDALIKTMHASTILYSDTTLYENMQEWLGTMSSSSIRPFRHTATVISLTMSSAFCDLAKGLDDSIVRTRSQLNGEQKKKSVNKGRVASIQQNLQAAEEKLDSVQTLLRDGFDVVFVHRYRDVDARIRAECVTALGYWILTYRQMFLEGSYLRYLGWVLSDTVAQTRGEVIKQLSKMFKDRNNRPALRAFTERFRPRIVEMAEADADPGVRASTVELLELLRQAEFLEPDDIDAVGKLIFDTEPRVRKAVAPFFVANIEDLYSSKLEDVDEDQLNEVLPAEDTDSDYLTPKRSWIMFKSLAEILTAYDGDAEEEGPRNGSNFLIVNDLDSRYMLATQSMFPQMDALKDWEALAGYLLHDHSSSRKSGGNAEIRNLYRLQEGEEAILLEVLDYTVKLHILELSEPTQEKKVRRTQKTKDDILEKQELTAHNLAQIVPKLLSKFGSVPAAASVILRLEHLLNVDLINDLQSSTTTYLSLLDDINKQFMSHSDRNVLAEASLALLNAQGYEQAKDATEGKVQDLWDSTIESLHARLKGQNVSARGTINPKLLTEIVHTVTRIANLASISDSTGNFETKPSHSKSTKKSQRSSQVSQSTTLELLLDLAKRGVADEDTTPQFVEAEDELTPTVLKAVLFYFMWKIQALRTAVTSKATASSISDSVTQLSSIYISFLETLTLISQSRHTLDPIRLLALSTMLDLATLFSTLRQPISKNKRVVELPPEILAELAPLLSSIPPALTTLISRSHSAAEKHFARKARKTLEAEPSSSKRRKHGDDDDPTAPPAEPELDDQAPPEDDSDASESSDGNEERDDPDSKAQAVLVAEKDLCDLTGKIVLALIAGVLKPRGIEEKVLRNRGRLGSNYREVVSFLDQGQKKGKAAPSKGQSTNGKMGTTQKKETGKEKSARTVIEDDDEVEEIEDVIEEDGEEDLERRGLVEERTPEEEEREGEEEQVVNGDEVEDEIMGD